MRSAEGSSPHRGLSPRSDMAALPQQGAAPLRRFAAIPAHPQKQYTRLRVCTIFAGFIILAFCLDPETGFSWIGEYDITADELLSGAGGNTATKTEQAEKLILDLLADGKELASEDIVKAAAEAGISERTVQNAKRNMGGILGARRVGGQWYNFIKKKQPPEPAS